MSYFKWKAYSLSQEFLAALVENNQTESGIKIPTLQEYTRFNIID